jgi:hypothetical protein
VLFLYITGKFSDFIFPKHLGFLDLPIMRGSNFSPVKLAQNAAVIRSWMNSLIFKEWLLKFDRKMKRQNRKVILFLDNAPCHPHFQLDNIKLQFFPPNQ